MTTFYKRSRQIEAKNAVRSPLPPLFPLSDRSDSGGFGERRVRSLGTTGGENVETQPSTVRDAKDKSDFVFPNDATQVAS